MKLEAYMQEALSDARKGLGFTAPNPAVGALVVKSGKIIGRGYHKKAGSAHAEPQAIKSAGQAVKGSTLFVTLEPCSTFGKTPPCTQAIINAGIKKVVIGCDDPNPAHAGAAYRILRAAGIEVVGSVLEQECKEVIKAFSHLQLTGHPFVTLKLACSLDGKIADAKGNSKWISGPESRKKVQALRRRADAILVGTETVIQDNPSLQPRPAYGHKPLRIIPDRQGRIPLNRNVFTDGFPTLGILGPEVSETRKKKLVSHQVDFFQTKTFNWTHLFKDLGNRGVQHILCEGGGQLAGVLLKADLVQEIEWVLAPKLIGEKGLPAVSGGWQLNQSPSFRLIGQEILGDDLWLRYQK